MPSRRTQAEFESSAFGLEDSSGYLVNRVARQIHNTFRRALVTHQLSPPQWFLLACCSERPQRQMALGQRLGVGSSAVTRMVDTLEVRKYVARCPGPQDRRTTMITTTALGVRVIGDAEPLLRRTTESLLLGLEPAEVLQLSRTLRRLLGATPRHVRGRM